MFVFHQRVHEYDASAHFDRVRDFLGGDGRGHKQAEKNNRAKSPGRQAEQRQVEGVFAPLRLGVN